MTAYILQAILFQLLFLLVYEILLKKETFFTYNRWYLLSTAGLSLVLPLIKIEALSFIVPAESLTQMSTIFLPEVFIGTGIAGESMEQLPEVVIETSGTGVNPWMIIYLIGIVTSLVILLKKYSALSRMFRLKKIAAEAYVNIIEVPNSTIACTFYRTIFLGDKLSEPEKHHILSHELVHVKQKHSLDLVFFEVLKVIFWFNPLIYIYQNRIATIHEFIADAAVVKVTEKRSYYEQLLNSAFSTQNISFINQFFNHSLIKKRIIMLQKSRSKTISKFKYLFIVPLMLAMLTIVACSEEKSIAEVETSKVEGQALYIQIEDFGNQTAEEKEKITNAIEGLKNSLGYDQVHIFDGKKTIIMSNDPETGKPQIIIENLHGKVTEEVRVNPDYQGSDIPFAVVDRVPVFPGCESLGSNEEKKKCMTEKVAEYVSENFDSGLAEQLGFKGTNRVIVVFKISPEGDVTGVRARAPHPDLEAEAIKVVSGLPKMTPGIHNGQNVGVSYSLPIVFQVNE